MVIIRPVEQARIFKITLSWVSITVSWPAHPVSERREHSEEAYYLAAFMASHEKREYGIYLDGDPVPVGTVNPLALKEGTYVDHACCYE
jgi:hypothetical protein